MIGGPKIPAEGDIGATGSRLAKKPKKVPLSSPEGRWVLRGKLSLEPLGAIWARMYVLGLMQVWARRPLESHLDLASGQRAGRKGDRLGNECAAGHSEHGTVYGKRLPELVLACRPARYRVAQTEPWEGKSKVRSNCSDTDNAETPNGHQNAGTYPTATVVVVVV